jgi:hypothetical protein
MAANCHRRKRKKPTWRTPSLKGDSPRRLTEQRAFRNLPDCAFSCLPNHHRGTGLILLPDDGVILARQTQIDSGLLGFSRIGRKESRSRSQCKVAQLMELYAGYSFRGMARQIATDSSGAMLAPLWGQACRSRTRIRLGTDSRSMVNGHAPGCSHSRALDPGQSLACRHNSRRTGFVGMSAVTVCVNVDPALHCHTNSLVGGWPGRCSQACPTEPVQAWHSKKARCSSRRSVSPAGA